MINEARRQRFEAVREATRELLGAEYSMHVQINDAMEPVLEVHGLGQAWLFGMMDEPIWGYDLEIGASNDQSWDLVKSVSLEMPERTDVHTVAKAIAAAVANDQQMLKGQV
jgi:hypothetical protein